MGTISEINQNKQSNTARSKTDQGAAFYFAGFSSPYTTAIPNEVIDVLMPILGEAELKVLMYIHRRTTGFGKTSDAISLSQFTEGIQRKDGTALDYGTGLGKAAVVRGIAGLEEKGIIWIQKNAGTNGGNGVNIYGLRFAKDSVATSKASFNNQNTYSINEYYPEEYEPATSVEQVKNEVSTTFIEDSINLIPGVVSLRYQDSSFEIPGVVSKKYPQHESKQIKSDQKIDNKQQVLAPIQGDTLARKIDVDDDYSEVEKELLKFGMPRQTLVKLTSQYSAEYLLEKIGAVQAYLCTNKIKNPAGFLLWAIDSDFQPTKPSLLEQELKFPMVVAMLAERQSLDPLVNDGPENCPTTEKFNRKGSVAPLVSEPQKVVASPQGYSSRPVYSDEQLSRPTTRSTTTDNQLLEANPPGATEQRGRNFSSEEVLEGLRDNLRIRLGRPELLEHLQGARLDIQRQPEGFRVTLHLRDTLTWRFINQTAQGVIKTALGWRLGSVCELEVAH